MEATRGHGSLADVARRFVDRTMAGFDGGHVVIGPVVWDVPAGSDQREWYFTVASGGGREQFRVDKLGMIGREARNRMEEMRQVTALELTTRGSFVTHLCDDELQQARLAAAIWPGAKSRRILAGIERDRRATGGNA